MRRLLFLPLFLATGPAAQPAAAQAYAVPVSFCGDRLVAAPFETLVTPGAQGRADYRVTLRNAAGAPLRFVVQVQGDVLGKPVGAQSLAAGQSTTLALGYAPSIPGRAPLRNEALANAVRISCLPG
ncbi:hypothetical protein ACI6QG_09095 [Roseococcus sp. DSY-14]|uniref:hypothetical protein n=1 Tax=Roseococcus sp. DSY-14 TaxID=3369650 RepID=UPI00387AA02F